MYLSIPLKVITLAFVALCLLQVQSFTPSTTIVGNNRIAALHMAGDDTFELEVKMPPSTSDLQAQLKIKSIISGPSKLIEVRYKLPFGLDIQPQKGMAVCTKDGAGGEKVGDVLRFSSQWTMGLPRGNGLISTAASFSGAIGWQCSLFDVMQAGQWEEVVEALTSNTPQRTDEVVLIFERALSEE